MQSLDDMKKFAEVQRKKCVEESIAYSLTLSALAPSNLILVVGAALLSLIAGASTLTENNVISEMQAGIMALVSGGFTVIHTKLGCDEYQAECKKLVSFYKAIAEDYANLTIEINEDELKRRLDGLNKELTTTMKSSRAFPFHWASNWAKKCSSNMGTRP